MNRKLLATGVACAFILSLIYFTGFLSNINLKLTDNFYGGKIPLDGIVIVGIDDLSLQEIGRWPWNRSVLAEGIEKLSSAKVIALDIGLFEKSLDDNSLSLAIKKAGNVILNSEYSFDGKTSELTPIFDANFGYANVITDKDGITRAVNLGLGRESFAAAIYHLYFNKPFDRNDERFLINYIGGPDKFKYYSYAEVYKNNLSDLTDKIIIVGAESPDLHDNYFVPTSKGKAMPGVEIHANILQSMINRQYLSEQPSWSVVAIIFLVSLFVSFAVSNWRLRISAIASLLILFCYLIASIFIFNSGIMMNVVYVPLAIAVTYLATTAVMYVSEKESKGKIVKAFEKYVSKAVLDEILKDPDKLKLGGVKREITVFFSDIRGFTSLSEQMPPEKLTHILNEYLTAMTNIVLHHQGVVDKYIGDAIMAFWGAPLKQPNHAELACQTSIDMIKELAKLNIKWTKEGWPVLNIGIGINSGFAVIGNMGSYERFDYTAIGDNINLGSRLEGLTKYYGVNIIMSEATKTAAGEGFISRELDAVAVKGKKQSVKIFELVCVSGNETSAQREFISLYESGLGLYRMKKWDEAILQFQKAISLKKDYSAEMMITKCQNYKENPPLDWDGTSEMNSK